MLCAAGRTSMVGFGTHYRTEIETFIPHSIQGRNQQLVVACVSDYDRRVGACVVCEHMYEQARVCGDPHTHARCTFGLVFVHACVVCSILCRSEIKSGLQ